MTYNRINHVYCCRDVIKSRIDVHHYRCRNYLVCKLCTTQELLNNFSLKMTFFFFTNRIIDPKNNGWAKIVFPPPLFCKYATLTLCLPTRYLREILCNTTKTINQHFQLYWLKIRCNFVCASAFIYIFQGRGGELIQIFLERLFFLS